MYLTHRIVLKAGNISLNSPLHISSGHKSSCQVDVTINEVRLQSDSMSEREFEGSDGKISIFISPVIIKGLLQLAFLLVNIAKV